MSNKTQLQTNNTALDALITRVNAAKDVAASLPEAGGGSGGGIEYEIIRISPGATSATYTLPRVTAAYGCCPGGITETAEGCIVSIKDLYMQYIQLSTFPGGDMLRLEANECLSYANGSVSGWSGVGHFGGIFSLLLINDPNAEAISE
jgi:hypothetical protein